MMTTLTARHKVTITLGLILVFLLTPTVAHADFVWPALLLEGRLLTKWAILAGLIVEFFFVIGMTAMNPLKSGLATLAMNAVSTVVGIVLIPALGLVSYFLIPRVHHLSYHSRNMLYWAITIALAAMGNTGIEILVLRRFSKAMLPRAMFWWLWVANVLSVGLAYASLIVWPIDNLTVWPAKH